MSGDAMFRAFIRPLSISMLEDSLPVNVSHAPGDVALTFLGELVGDRNDPLSSLKSRYRAVSKENDEPFMVPMHDLIMHHVVRPLVEAKQCYVLGMPVACIAQAGLVGEMVALWRFRMLSPILDGKPFDDDLQKLLMGREFDKLGQEERVRVLRALDSLDDQTVQAFGQLRSIRRQYLHFMVDPQRDVDHDARHALVHANTLVVKTLGVSYREGRVVLPDRVARFIHDILEIQPQTSADAQVDEVAS